MSEQNLPDPPPPRHRARPSQDSQLVDPFQRLEDAGLGPLFDQMPATIWVTDHELRLTFVQGHLFHRIGVKPETVLGRRLTDILLDGREDHPLIQGHLTALSGSETSVRIEWGGEIYSARIAPVRDESGEVVGCAGVNQVTAWVPDNDGTLRESDVRLRRVIDASMVGIVFANADGRITDANDAFLELSGYSTEDLTTGQILWPSLTPMDRQHEHVTVLGEMRRDGRIRPFETELLRKDGAKVAVLASSVRLSARRGEGVGFLLDISARKRVERHLHAQIECAAMLIGATDASALTPWMREACRLFEWNGALLWRTTAPGTLATPSAVNVGAAHAAAIEPFAARAAASDGFIAAEAVAALVLPLVTENGCRGVVAFVRPNGPAPDADLIATMQALVAQAARFLSRA
jgi:PAS domain S-box-containing protein